MTVRLDSVANKQADRTKIGSSTWDFEIVKIAREVARVVNVKCVVNLADTIHEIYSLFRKIVPLSLMP